MMDDRSRQSTWKRNTQPVVGVHIEQNRLCAVELQRGLITRWTQTLLQGDTQTDPAQRAASLRDALAPFALRERSGQCWALGAFPSLQVRLLSIPKPRPGHAAQMVYWAFRRELPFDVETAQFDYEVEGEHQAEGIKQIDVTAYTSLRTEIDALQAEFAAANVPLDGIVIPHFALRNLCRAAWVNHCATRLICYVGEEYSCVQIIHHDRVMLSRVFITGMYALRAALSDRYPGWSTAAILHHWCTADAADQRRLLEKMMPVIKRLMQQIDRSLDAFLVQQQLDEGEVDIYMAGELASVPCVIEAMQQGRESAIAPLNVMDKDRLAKGVTMPHNQREAVLLGMAAGTALSAAQNSPNLLCVQSTRVYEAQSRRRTFRLVAAVCVLLLLAGIGSQLLRETNHRKRHEIHVLQAQIERAEESAGVAAITELLVSAEVRASELRELITRYMPIAAFGEIGELTPSEIQLDEIRIIWDGPSGGPGHRTRAEVVGHIHGPAAHRASHLASYSLALENGTLLDSITVSKSQSAADTLGFELGITLSSVINPMQAVAPLERGGMR